MAVHLLGTCIFLDLKSYILRQKSTSSGDTEGGSLESLGATAGLTSLAGNCGTMEGVMVTPSSAAFSRLR